MLKKSPVLGGILLVAGTSIGAGMLALPVLTSFAGFFPSFLTLSLCWAFMVTTAYLMLDVNLSCPGEVNLISMAGRTLGVSGKMICWVVYLLLLYSLTAAYIAGSTPLFLHAFYVLTNVELPTWSGPFPLLALFGLFVYLGTRTVDYVNRLLMAGLVISYFALTIFLPSYVQSKYLMNIDFSAIWMPIPILFTSYGFHIIIPTLTNYLHHDARKLRLTIFVGSLIPFLVYILWEFLILGTVPLTGEAGLARAWEEGTSAIVPLSLVIKNPGITIAASTFSFFAIITSFLGVSLSLSDFLGDGLKMHRFTWGRELACLLTFAPPLLFALTYQRGFVLALQYAGLFVAILLGIMPALMAWTLPKYKRPEKRLLLSAVVLISLFVIGLSI